MKKLNPILDYKTLNPILDYKTLKIVDSKSTSFPGDPVNTSATKKGCDKNL